MLLAFVLSIAIFIGWRQLSFKMGWAKPQTELTAEANRPSSTENKPTTELVTPANILPGPTNLDENQLEQVQPVLPLVDEEKLILENDMVRLTVSNKGIHLHGYELKNIKADPKEDELNLNLIAQNIPEENRFLSLVAGTDLSQHVFAIDQSQTNSTTAVFTTTLPSGDLMVKLSILEDYNLQVEVNTPTQTTLSLGLGCDDDSLMNAPTYGGVSVNGVFVHIDGDLERTDEEEYDEVATLLKSNNISYLGQDTMYFAKVVFSPQTTWKISSSTVERFENKEAPIFGLSTDLTPGTHILEMFWGPKELKQLQNLQVDISDTIDYGWLGTFSKYLFYVLVWINSFTNNYGFAILLMTLLLKLVTYPINHKQAVFSRKMQKLQPKIKEIKAKFEGKEDTQSKQKMQMEILDMQKKNGVNPFTGCLPALIQMPIFFAFFYLLRSMFELRHSSFALWIK